MRYTALYQGQKSERQEQHMGMTMSQKIMAKHAGLESVREGQLIKAKLDMVLGNDITSPVAIKEMDKMKVKGVFDKDKVRLILYGTRNYKNWIRRCRYI